MASSILSKLNTDKHSYELLHFSSHNWLACLLLTRTASSSAYMLLLMPESSFSRKHQAKLTFFSPWHDLHSNACNTPCQFNAFYFCHWSSVLRFTSPGLQQVTSWRFWKAMQKTACKLMSNCSGVLDCLTFETN